LCKNNRIVPKNGLSEYIKYEKCVTENALGCIFMGIYRSFRQGN
jgi:hypothetical protein